MNGETDLGGSRQITHVFGVSGGYGADFGSARGLFLGEVSTEGQLT